MIEQMDDRISLIHFALIQFFTDVLIARIRTSGIVQNASNAGRCSTRAGVRENLVLYQPMKAPRYVFQEAPPRSTYREII